MLPPCCDDTPSPEDRSIHDPVPEVTQYASPNLIERIAYDGHDPADDPRWAESGAPTQAIYARWCRHICGIACLRMALLHRDGDAPNLFQLLAGARSFGAYTQESGEIKGLIYAPFAAYARESHDMPVDVHGVMELHDVLNLLDARRMVMVSVSKEIRRPDVTPERRGGHLVLAVGHEEGRIVFRNPSGHTPETRSPSLPLDRFAEFFGGRGMSLDLRRTVQQAPGLTSASRPVASTPTT
ncbi:peptidase [Streptomyces sp. MBT33]|uniref:peptidase n=1 Tax=Streptomyces sp. MBT33 TaxID=1488363 RepID=UPI00190AFFBF|nr:peptidase [Streptomyces sp. MBT33]MBK3639476.1 peptidase [Streptomyces sp. MBT33]